MIDDKLRHCQETLTQIVELENASEKVAENLRKIEERRAASLPLPTSEKDVNADSTSQIVPANMEAARLLFEEQLDFLSKEKCEIFLHLYFIIINYNFYDFYLFRAKLISELPPLAPVASSEDLSLSDLENSQSSNKRKNSAELVSLKSKDEYAIDFQSPPVLNRLPNLEVLKNRIKRNENARLPRILNHKLIFSFTS